ncbi:hypothetical protein BP00DRAFT_424604 [Aspergillus indologenus CBS 114.80]|uniref:Uncharacterized protein n=1 Tax=Aspergillus indologenus CBS 114.80 TaxID=1450541 RepID=A0A2V5IFG1_9EURO|nr:hypothetical protein BP00DRAFT_424604 [Aspergillus indologenus CBS 114.80]
MYCTAHQIGSLAIPILVGYSYGFTFSIEKHGLVPKGVMEGKSSSLLRTGLEMD